MHRGFGGTAFEPIDERRDREVTLGPTMVAGLAVALFALCAVCFLAGYAMGHRSTGEAALRPAATPGPFAAQVLGSQSKPNASQNNFQPATDAGAGMALGTATTPSAPAYQASPQAVTSSGAAAVVQTALPAQSAAQPISAVGQTVQPALAQAGTWMVQIAAVSHPEDADVLVSALRKRGYTVSVRHDPLDNLLHVQVGPFTTHNDAANMRQKLLNDGYNAVIEP